MIATHRIRRVVCTIVRVPADDQAAPRGRGERPSRLLPWADPYIAGLVRQLQSEVRMQRAGAANWQQDTSPRLDLEPPTPAFDADWDWDWQDEPRWALDEEQLDDAAI